MFRKETKASAEASQVSFLVPKEPKGHPGYALYQKKKIILAAPQPRA